MSDLIEKLETYYKKASDAKSQNAAMIYEDKFRELCWAAASEILSALKTVRGIEAAKRILIEWDEEVKIWRINTYTSEGWQSGKTLAAAIEAAGKKGEGR